MKRAAVWGIAAVIILSCFLQGETAGAEQMVIRAGFAQTLFEMAGGAVTDEESMPFSDMDRRDQNAEGVIWCERMCIVYGMGDGRFGPEERLTRQEMFTMLFRFGGVMQEDMAPAIGFEGIADRESVSGWAAQGIDWALATGLMSADGEGNIGPLEPVTAEELSSLLEAYVQWTGQ